RSVDERGDAFRRHAAIADDVIGATVIADDRIKDARRRIGVQQEQKLLCHDGLDELKSFRAARSGSRDSARTPGGKRVDGMRTPFPAALSRSALGPWRLFET